MEGAEFTRGGCIKYTRNTCNAECRVAVLMGNMVECNSLISTAKALRNISFNLYPRLLRFLHFSNSLVSHNWVLVYALPGH